jgi:hypothetical protein
MAAHEFHGITVPVSVVPRVETQKDFLGIGICQKSLDLILVFHVAVCVRVKHHRQPETIARQVGYRDEVFALLRKARDLDTPAKQLAALRREAVAQHG